MASEFCAVPCAVSCFISVFPDFFDAHDTRNDNIITGSNIFADAFFIFIIKISPFK